MINDTRWSQFCLILLERDLLPNVESGKDFIRRAIKVHKKIIGDEVLEAGELERLRDEGQLSNTEGGELASFTAWPTMRSGAANTLSNVALIRTRAPINEYIDEVIASHD